MTIMFASMALMFVVISLFAFSNQIPRTFLVILLNILRRGIKNRGSYYPSIISNSSIMATSISQCEIGQGMEYILTIIGLILIGIWSTIKGKD